jgi:hypothetical protein
MRTIRILVCIWILSLGGCSQIAQFILFNDTASPVGIVLDNHIFCIPPNSKRALPDKPAFDSEGKAYTVIMLRGNIRLGYVFDENFLNRRDFARGTIFRLKYYFIMTTNNYIYMASPWKNGSFPMSVQPSGFPAKPVVVQ